MVLLVLAPSIRILVRVLVLKTRQTEVKKSTRRPYLVLTVVYVVVINVVVVSVLHSKALNVSCEMHKILRTVGFDRPSLANLQN